MTKILRNKSNIDLDYPICRPSLDLDFTQEGLDPRITFSRGSIGTRVNRNRLIETVSANQPRFDYDPVTGECKGLFIEESRSNLVTYSEDFSNASWARNNQNINTNVITAPDGTLTADKLITINASSSHDLFKTPNLSSNTYTLSIFAKAAEQNLMRLRIDDGIIGRNTIFNLTTGSVSSNTNVTSSTITPYSNGWYRCSITVTTNIINLVFNTPYPYSGDGTSGIYIWGAQLEAGAFPTSYIPTTASTVTRSADLAQMTGTNFSSWYNQTEGSMVASFSTIYEGSQVSGRTPGVWGLSQPTTEYGFSNGYALAVRTDTRQFGFQHRFISANIDIQENIIGPTTSSTVQPYVKQKVSCSYLPDLMRASLKGATVLQIRDTNYNSLSQTALLIGTQRIGGAAIRELTGHISRLTYYPRALKPNQLQYLTQ